jgi:hypothetical protein
MSKEIVDQARRGYDAFNRRDVDIVTPAMGAARSPVGAEFDLRGDSCSGAANSHFFAVGRRHGRGWARTSDLSRVRGALSH